MPIDKGTRATNLNAGVRPTSVEQLEYVADLLAELKDIADAEGCDTLAGLLDLSQAEARRRAGGFVNKQRS